MTKKVQAFNAVHNRCKRAFDDMVAETKAFKDLFEKQGVVAEDKAELQAKLDKVNNQFEKLEDKLTGIAADITAAELTGCNDSVQQLRDKIRIQADNARTLLRESTIKWNTAQEQKAAQAQVEAERAQKEAIRPQRPAFIKELKPKQIPNGSFTMAELRSWLEDFESYFKTNQIAETHGPKEQRIFLKNALEENLAKELFNKVLDDDAPVIGGVGSGSCLDALRELMESKNPLEVRRYNFYKCNQKPKEKLSAWRVRLKNEGRECDLNDFTVEDHYYFRLLIGTENQKFREELMKLSSKKDMDIDKLIATLESRQTLEDALEPDKVNVYKLSAYKKEQKRKLDEKVRQKGLESKGKPCSYCGRGNCQGKNNRENCRAWGKDCLKCGKPNHFATVCHSQENASNDDKNGDKVKVSNAGIKVNCRGLRIVPSTQNGLESSERPEGANALVRSTLNGEGGADMPSNSPVLEAESGDLLKEHLLLLKRAFEIKYSAPEERVEEMEYRALKMSSDDKDGFVKVNDLAKEVSDLPATKMEDDSKEVHDFTEIALNADDSVDKEHSTEIATFMV